MINNFNKLKMENKSNLNGTSGKLEQNGVSDKQKVEIQERLYSFITEMNEWEKECNNIANDKALKFEEQFEKQKKLVEKIFVEYCTKKERKQGRPTTISYGNDNSYNYDPKLETITKVEETSDNKKVIVYTETKLGDMPMKNQYSMVNKNQMWLIDTKKRYSNWKKKWVVETL